MADKITRRDSLKLSGLALGGVALGSGMTMAGSLPGLGDPSSRNSLFDRLPVFPLGEPLAADEMRITFLGTSCIPRLAQECNSVFVEVGGGPDGTALDQFIFDCGSGVVAKYNAMGIPMSRMDKIFLTHLHGDHMSDLIHIYCFGPAEDRKSPLYVWGPSRSNVPDPVTGEIYDDGTEAFCVKLRDLLRWHSESFSFGYTSYASCDPLVPGIIDGFDLVPFELPWEIIGDTGYNRNDVKITHFPVVHCRQGSIGYKLEWNGMVMIFTGDTKPNYTVIDQASNDGKGIDVLIHEMVVPAEVWAARNSGYTPADGDNWIAALNYATAVQNSSHTPQRAFGYILSQIHPAPRLGVGTHFQATDDTIRPALRDIRHWYPKGDVTIASDLMVLNVSKNKIRQRRAVVNDFAWYPQGAPPHKDNNIPKYHDANNRPDPFAQLDPGAPVIDPELYNAP